MLHLKNGIKQLEKFNIITGLDCPSYNPLKIEVCKIMHDIKFPVSSILLELKTTLWNFPEQLMAFWNSLQLECGGSGLENLKGELERFMEDILAISDDNWMSSLDSQTECSI